MAKKHRQESLKGSTVVDFFKVQPGVVIATSNNASEASLLWQSISNANESRVALFPDAFGNPLSTAAFGKLGESIANNEMPHLKAGLINVSLRKCMKRFQTSSRSLLRRFAGLLASKSRKAPNVQCVDNDGCARDQSCDQLYK